MNFIEETIKKDNDDLIQQVKVLRYNAEVAKQKLHEYAFPPLKDATNRDERITYIIQFIPLIREVVLFPDNELLKKLQEYGISKPVTKWFTPIDEILNELEELKKVNGAIFFLNTYLMAARFYIEMAAIIELVESFDLQVKHGKIEESNILYKNVDNFYRRHEYNLLKGQKGKMDKGDEALSEMIDLAKKEFGNEFNLKYYLLNALKGDFFDSKELFSKFIAQEISENQVYFLLFPLLKLVYKDRELYSEEEFYELDEVIYGGSYRKYKISRVKKILSIK